MIGLGTIINTVAIILGGIAGGLFGSLLTEHHQDTLTKTCGVSVLFIGTAGAMQYMMKIENGTLGAGKEMFLVICLVLGAIVGETIDLERLLERFGEWLKQKTGNAKDKNFVTGFLNATLTVCIGAMTVVGSIQDGLTGNWSILGTKSILDLIIVMVMTCSLGKGCTFSAIPVLVIQSSITAAATLIKPIMTDPAMANLSMVGSVLIFCVGVNLVWGKKVHVGNLLPAIVFAVAAAFLPINIM